MDDKQDDVWAIVELMGHVKLAGKLTEVERFGVKMGRLDLPQREEGCPDCQLEGKTCGSCQRRFVTQLFGGQSVYRITIVSEEVARHVNRSTSPAPVLPWDFPKQLAAPVETPSRVYPDCGHTVEDCDCETEKDYDDE